MSHALLITAKPQGGLTFEDNDVVEVLDGRINPGTAVSPTNSNFLFCYVSDKTVDDPEVRQLVTDLSELGDEPPVTLKKRRYQVTLTGSEFKTWVPEDEAEEAGIVKTWTEIQALLTDKGA